MLGGEGGSRAVKRQEMEFESFSQSLPEDSESDEFPSDEGHYSIDLSNAV